MQRLQPASEKTLQIFKDAGMSPIEHTLTAEESGQLEKVFAELPPLHQQVLKEHLASISFLDDMPNTALTSTLNFGSDFPVFNITIRAAIFKQNASEWMSEKERTCFNAANSPLVVSCEIGQLSALLYVMLHETTHIVDGVLQIAKGNFGTGTWHDITRIAPEFSDALIDSTRYRGGKPLPIDRAEKLYQALSLTPFVSLFSTSRWHEDLAEYLSVYHFTQKLGQPFRITIRDKGKEIFIYEPMKSNYYKAGFCKCSNFISHRHPKGNAQNVFLNSAGV
ncbi:MAG: hypothetical protein ABIN80_13435 [Dyadobacter sp.]|uniref:hypothetical protein n=1 Tax=Dyadobacter sp. TaxID=1914288 RepID=UPI0032642458